MNWLRIAAVALLALWLGSIAQAAEPPLDGTWNFEATLDGKPIGEHRFRVASQGGSRTVESIAAFEVKLLGFTAYRYRHTANEEWRDGCLVGLKASTDDDGKASTVNARKEGDVLIVVSPAGREELAGCVMSFAYWNPAIRKQSHLLNPQTGRYETVQFSAPVEAALDERSEGPPARRVRLSGPKDPIDLWYSSRGEWLGLDSIVAGGRKLSYRLK